ncbi:PIN domain-containing protein [Mycolicibacterium goodii]|uniref:PIN domain-containing protein n=1 Tax=Mycolicibacterium goodii TaxID=134601 RepID=A0ABS6HXQ8_MYCGD|nr:PIN domain-containing protein [Mycolicibacterium goodii]MBU8827459.1 hypothetical protein [Mycolicibacterium goodii]MBU8841468.1 hypothetical protein [Mycolicibacterium goodii]OKH62241.1 hypothetical protein EB74_17230 [Mycobacterium sp. SWH-M5]
MSARRTTYAENLISELGDIADAYMAILARSGINYVNPNGAGSHLLFVGAADYGWAASSPELQSSRMELLGKIRSWAPRFRLLFPHPIPSVEKRIKRRLAHLERWLVRSGGNDHSIPSTVDEAQHRLAETFDDIRALFALLSDDAYPIRLIVDTNALIDNPNVAAYAKDLGPKYMVHLLPIVLGELDDLKRGGRSDLVRSGAQRAITRIKGLRNNGNILDGVRVEGQIVAKFEHVEPRGADLPDWLDLSVPDDRLVASALLLQSQHPGSAFYVATSDINLQTKLHAVGLPFVEPPTV